MEETKDQEIENLPMPKQKKTINRAQLNELTLLQNNKGLKRLYEECSKFRISGDTKSDLKKLINLYKEWHFGVAPKFEFNYFVQKCQALGTKPPIRAFMTRIRKVHAGQTTWEDIENPTNPYAEEDNISVDRHDQDRFTGEAAKKQSENNAEPEEEDFYAGINAAESNDLEEIEYLESLNQGKRKATDDLEVLKLQKLDDYDDIYF